MKIRCYNELERAISNEWRWRKQELENTHALLTSSRPSNSQTISRAGVALTYAHWEGFVKKSSGYYLEYVHAKKRTLNQYSHNIYSLAIFNHIKSECPEKLKYTSLVDILQNAKKQSMSSRAEY